MSLLYNFLNESGVINASRSDKKSTSVSGKLGSGARKTPQLFSPRISEESRGAAHDDQASRAQREPARGAERAGREKATTEATMSSLTLGFWLRLAGCIVEFTLSTFEVGALLSLRLVSLLGAFVSLGFSPSDAGARLSGQVFESIGSTVQTVDWNPANAFRPDLSPNVSGGSPEHGSPSQNHRSLQEQVPVKDKSLAFV